MVEVLVRRETARLHQRRGDRDRYARQQGSIPLPEMQGRNHGERDAGVDDHEDEVVPQHHPAGVDEQLGEREAQDDPARRAGNRGDRGARDHAEARHAHREHGRLPQKRIPEEAMPGAAQERAEREGGEGDRPAFSGVPRCGVPEKQSREPRRNACQEVIRDHRHRLEDGHAMRLISRAAGGESGRPR